MFANRLFQVVSLVVVAISPSVLFAQPAGLPALKVVADRGGEAAQPYFIAIGAAGVVDDHSIAATRSQPYSIAEMLPVVTPALSPGSVDRREIDMPAAFQPLFIVGEDQLSLAWLQARYDRLREMGANGLAVNVQTEQGLEALRKAVPGVRIDPVSGGDLAERLSLTHYPVLITRAGVEQ